MDMPYSQKANSSYTTHHKTSAHVEHSRQNKKGKAKKHMQKQNINEKNCKRKPKTVSGGEESSLAHAPPGSEKAKFLTSQVSTPWLWHPTVFKTTTVLLVSSYENTTTCQRWASPSSTSRHVCKRLPPNPLGAQRQHASTGADVLKRKPAGTKEPMQRYQPTFLLLNTPVIGECVSGSLCI